MCNALKVIDLEGRGTLLAEDITETPTEMGALRVPDHGVFLPALEGSCAHGLGLPTALGPDKVTLLEATGSDHTTVARGQDSATGSYALGS